MEDDSKLAAGTIRTSPSSTGAANSPVVNQVSSPVSSGQAYQTLQRKYGLDPTQHQFISDPQKRFQFNVEATMLGGWTREQATKLMLDQQLAGAIALAKRQTPPPEYDSWTSEQQFKWSQDVGLVPKSAVLVRAVDAAGYIPQKDLAKMGKWGYLNQVEAGQFVRGIESSVEANKARTAGFREQEAFEKEQIRINKILLPYKKDGGYDLISALENRLDPSVLEEVFGKEEVSKARIALREEESAEIDYYEQANTLAQIQRQQELSGKLNSAIAMYAPYDPVSFDPELKRIWEGKQGEEDKKLLEQLQQHRALIAAEIVVPGIWARRWGELSAPEKAAYIAIDVLTLVPFVGAIARGAREVGIAGRMARISSAAKAVGREIEAIAVGPVNMIVQPLETAKSLGRETRNIIENLIRPSKLPEAVITTSGGSVRLRIKETTSPEQAMAFRDKLMALAKQGERPVVEMGNYRVELVRSPLMRELGGGLATTSPQGERFLRQINELGGIKVELKVSPKTGIPLPMIEQGLFVSHEPLPRFATSSAFGTKGEKPVIIITSKETAEKAVSSGKIYAGTVEMESKFLVGERLPAPKQKLFTRIGSNSVKVEIWLEKPLSLRQIAKLKAEALVELIKAPFKPPIKVSQVGRANRISAGLARDEVEELVKILKESGNIEQAQNLVRAEAVARAMRAAPPSLSKAFRVERRSAAKERQRVESTIGRRIGRREARTNSERILGTARAKSVEREKPEARIRREEEETRIQRLRREQRERQEREEREARREGGTRRAERSRREDRASRTSRMPRVRIGEGRIAKRIKTSKGIAKRAIYVSKKEKQTLPAQKSYRGAVAWQQGALKRDGKLVPVWKVWRRPYTQNDLDTFFQDELPPGVETVSGIKSAQDTIQQFAGSIAPGEDRVADIGAFLATIESAPTAKPGSGEIRFRRDNSETSLKKLALGTTIAQLLTSNYNEKIPKSVANRMLSMKLSKMTPLGIANEVNRASLTSKQKTEALSHLPTRVKNQVKAILEDKTVLAPTRGYPKATKLPTKLRRKKPRKTDKTITQVTL